MKTFTVQQAPPNVPSTLDRNRSIFGERLAMWLLGVVLLVICVVSSLVAVAGTV